MSNTNALDSLLNFVPDPPEALIDNWQTAFIWLALSIILFALISLYFGIRRGIQGKHVNKGMLPYVKWPLLFASAGFNIFFTYYVFLPAGMKVAAFSAIVMGGVNLAEAYLVRLIIATWRHNLQVVFRLALLFTIPVFLYSLMAAGSSFSTMMNKNKDSQVASQLELQAAQDRIKQADAQVKEAQIGAEKGNLLTALYQTDVRNSRGTKVSFNEVKTSCLSVGWYAVNYPELCNQYRNLQTGVHTAANVASANTAALATSASEKQRMAQIIKDRPPEITPTLLGFGLGIAAVGFIVSLALESAIIGVGFFEELFIKPTPLPGLVKFANKALDWDADTITQRGLQVDISPSPGTVNFSSGTAVANPFSSFGWNAKTPGVAKRKAPVSETRNATVHGTNAPVTSNKNVPVQKAVQPASELANAPVIKNQNGHVAPGQIKQMLERWKRADSAKVGDMIECATCGGDTEKRIDTKKFCGSGCRIEYHRLTKEGNT